jgi:hypothetical protein
MKRLILALILVAGSVAFATSANAQVYVGARIGFRAPFHRAYIAPGAVYGAPVYNAPAPYYDNGYYDNTVVVQPPVYNTYPYYRHYGRPYYHDYRGRRNFRRW